MTDPMLHTFLALLTAHLLADFAFQTGWMVAHKHRLPVLGLHIAIVFVLSLLLLGGHLMLVLAISVAHFIIDYIKVHVLPDRLWTYLGDQAAHLLTLLLATLWVPDAFATGPWATHADAAMPLAILLCGFLLASPAGGPAVGLMMASFRIEDENGGLENAGRLIGLLERGLIFLMVMMGEPAGIGFLIAAKSILRFNTVSDNRALTEYVIIGTLASFGWALAVSLVTRAALGGI